MEWWGSRDYNLLVLLGLIWFDLVMYLLSRGWVFLEGVVLAVAAVL